MTIPHVVPARKRSAASREGQRSERRGRAPKARPAPPAPPPRPTVIAVYRQSAELLARLLALTEELTRLHGLLQGLTEHEWGRGIPKALAWIPPHLTATDVDARGSMRELVHDLAVLVSWLQEEHGA